MLQNLKTVQSTTFNCVQVHLGGWGEGGLTSIMSVNQTDTLAMFTFEPVKSN